MTTKHRLDPLEPLIFNLVIKPLLRLTKVETLHILDKEGFSQVISILLFQLEQVNRASLYHKM